MNPVRLIDADGNVTTSTGLLEVFVNGKWGTVCDDDPANSQKQVSTE